MLLFEPYPLYAENARKASGPDFLQRCQVCHWRPSQDERVADLVNDAGLIHTSCASTLAGTAPGR